MSRLRNIFKGIINNKESKPVYIGDLAVVPRNQIKQYFEDGWYSNNTDQTIKKWVNEFVTLPFASETKELPENAVKLDIVVSGYQFGTDGFLWAEPLLPIIWRPKIKIYGRLVKASNNKVIGSFCSKETISWKEYFVRVFSLRNLLTLSGSFSEKDMKILLSKSLLKILEWARKKV